MVGSWHPERRDRESKCVGGGDGPAIWRGLALPGPPGQLPSCGMSSCRETGITWGREEGRGMAFSRLQKCGSGEQILFVRNR